MAQSHSGCFTSRWAGPALALQAAAGSREAALARWAGCWAAEGQELNSQGERFRQTGIARATLSADGKTLRIDQNLEVVEATGYYRRLPRRRPSSELLRLHPDRALLTIEDGAASGPAPPPRRDLSMSASGDEMFRSFMFHHPVRNVTLFATTIHRLVRPDRMEGQTLLGDLHGTFRETYIEAWHRLPESDPRCATAQAG